MLLAEGEGPEHWWKEFCREFNKQLPLPSALWTFQRLSQGIEQFQSNFFRTDPFYLLVWLAYLESHLYSWIFPSTRFADNW